ncbi:MAG: MFS transporter [Candidatus Hodarchaeota archaeon]
MIISKKSVILLLISVLTYNTAAMALIYYLPRYLLYIGAELPIVQLVTTIYPFSMIFLPQLLGKYSDKIQNRYLFFILGSIGASLFYFTLIFTRDLVLITVILIFYGMCGASYRLNFTLYQELTKNNPKFVTFYNAISVFGWFLGSQIGGIFIDIYGISQIFVFLLIISLINAFIIIFIRENRNAILEHYNSEEVENTELINLSNVEKKNIISKSIYVALFARHFGVRPIITILAVLMSFHLSSDTQIGFLLGFNPLLQFFLMLLTGRIITKKNEKYILMIGFFLSSGAILGYMLATDFFGFLLSQIMISSSFALFWNATQIYIAQKTNPRNKGKYLGYANSSFFSGGFSGGLFFSLLLSFNPNYYAFMWIMMIFPLLSTITILMKFKSD